MGARKNGAREGETRDIVACPVLSCVRRQLLSRSLKYPDMYSAEVEDVQK